MATLALLLNTQTALLTSYSSLYLVYSLEPWLPYSQCQTWQDPSPTCPPLDQLAPNSVQLSTEEFWLTRVLGSDRSGVLVDGGLTSLHPPLALHLLVLLSLAAALLCLPTRSLARLQTFLLLAICLLLAALTTTGQPAPGLAGGGQAPQSSLGGPGRPRLLAGRPKGEGQLSLEERETVDHG